MFYDRVRRGINDFSIHTILMKAESRNDANVIPMCKLSYVVSYGFNDSGSFITQPCREIRLVNILACAVHNLRTVDTNSPYADLNLIRIRRGDLHVLNLQDLSATNLIKNYDLRHSRPQ